MLRHRLLAAVLPFLCLLAMQTPAAAAEASRADCLVQEAWEYYDSGNLDESDARFQKALTLVPSLGMAHVGLALSAEIRETAPQAEAHFNKALACGLPPVPAARCHAGLGQLHREAGRLQASLDAYRSAISLDDRSGYHVGLAKTWIALEKPDNALGEAETACRMDPGHTGAWLARGTACNMLKRHREAVEHIKKGVVFDQENSPYYYQLGLAHLGLGALDEAYRYMEGALELNENRAEHFDGLAYVLWLKGNRADAVQLLQLKLRRFPDARTRWPALAPVEQALTTPPGGSPQR